MKLHLFYILAPLLVVVNAPCEELIWPFDDLSHREAALAGLRRELFVEAIFAPLPKGITLYLDADKEPGDDGWIMVTVRQRNGEGSGGDPNVSPALAHFYVREFDGAIEWYDVVNDQRRSWAEFLKDRKEN
ncbi:MAG: hypothetical protein KA250_13155 [Verrucomicrobiales bacterium]|jgi:hypothetical protein|nr:hypothetical protein [Verrucomicrobiales bacterium]MBP9225596.1 hypothetical protein [Verrucomicrobiales bacterium]HQZ27404.1 hypothetical protein [Verrucomicrobiales bacterium]